MCVVGSATNETNVALARQWRWRELDAVRAEPHEALRLLRRTDVALGRLDVLPSLDGVEPGLLSLLWLERRGVRMLNRAGALVVVHDKLRTARRLQAVGIPHPRTDVVRHAQDLLALEPTLVLKPRFGSWGRDVLLCSDRDELARARDLIRTRGWFRRHGVLAQALLPSPGHDLRVIVAGGHVIGAAERTARPGEWRTNVSLGGSLRPAAVPADARALAVRAAAATGMDLVGVDLLPSRRGFVVLELNGAVDFDERYSLGGRDVYAASAQALGLLAPSLSRSTNEGR